MSVGRRAQVRAAIVSQGGGGTGPCPEVVVSWGPQFGEVDEMVVGVQGPTVTALALDHTRPVGVSMLNNLAAIDYVADSAIPRLGIQTTVPTYGPDYQVAPVGIQTQLTDLALDYTGLSSVGIQTRFAEQAVVYNDQNVGLQVTFPEVAAAYNEINVGVTPQLTLLETVYNEINVGIQATMPAIGIDNETRVGVQATLPELALAYNERTVGVQATMPAVALDYERSLGIQTTMPALALDGTRRAGLCLAGSMTGAPNWLERETSATSNAVGTTNISVGVSTLSIQAGDFLLLFVGAHWQAVGGLINTPAGWTLLLNNAVADEGRVFYRWADGNEANFTVTTTQNVTAGVAEVHRVQGVHPINPIDATATATVLATSLDTDPDSPSVTTTVASTLVFAWLFHDHAALSQTHTPGANHTERSDFQAGPAGVFVGSHSQTRIFAAVGATGTIVHDCTETVATNGVMFRVALRPGPIPLSACEAPEDVEGLVLWLDASKLSGLADGDSVTTWPDASIYDRDATQASASSKPSFQTSEINGLPCVRFDGTNDELLITTGLRILRIRQGATLFIVYNPTADGSVGLVNIQSAGTETRFGYGISGTNQPNPYVCRADGDGTSSYVCTATSGWQLIAVTHDYTVADNFVYLDGASTAHCSNTGLGTSGSATSDTDSSAFSIGSFNGAGFFNGDIAEIILYDRVLTTAERESVEDYLIAKYGL